MKQGSTKSILVIDDSVDCRETMTQILLDAHFDVWDVACPDEAYQLLKREKFDLIICDLHMPFTLGADQDEYPYSHEVGVKTILELSDTLPATPIVAVSASDPSDLSEYAKELGAIPALSKPFSARMLLSTIHEALECWTETPIH